MSEAVEIGSKTMTCRTARIIATPRASGEPSGLSARVPGQVGAVVSLHRAGGSPLAHPCDSEPDYVQRTPRIYPYTPPAIRSARLAYRFRMATWAVIGFGFLYVYLGMVL